MELSGKKVKIEVPAELVGALMDAINCYADCVQGNRKSIEDVWFIENDEKLTGGSFLAVVEELYTHVHSALYREEQHLVASDPDMQDMLHRFKMWRKHGIGL